MRSSYKEPMIWAFVVSGLVLALIGWLVESFVKSDIKYFFMDMDFAGMALAAFFAVGAAANYVGTKFCTEAEFAKRMPLRLVVVGFCAALASLLLTFLLQGDLEAMAWMLGIGVATLVLASWTAFFVQGMRVPTEHDS